MRFQHFNIFSSAAIFLSVIFGSCTNNKITGTMSPLKAKNYLALGDSYTIGEAIIYTDCFPVQLTNKLTEQNLKVIPPQIIAVTGWTTSDLLESLAINSPATDFDLVTLLIGVNNQYQGKSIDNYKDEFSRLLDLSIKYAKGKKENVIVISIPDYGVTPFALNSDTAQIARQIDLFNAANKIIAEAAGVLYVDITSISRNHDPALVAADGLHPSAHQYGLWVNKLFPFAHNILQ